MWICLVEEEQRSREAVVLTDHLKKNASIYRCVGKYWNLKLMQNYMWFFITDLILGRYIR